MPEIIRSSGQFNVGDWVRFYSEGRFVIGQVEYMYKETGGHEYVATDRGPVRFDSVLERRSRTSPAGGG